MIRKMLLIFMGFILLFYSYESVFAGDTRALVEYGINKLEEEQYDEALETFSAILRADPANIDAKFYMGYINFKRENLPEAIKFFSEVIKVKSEYQASAYYYLGLCYYWAGNEEKAKKAFLKALKIAPKGELADSIEGFLKAIEEPEIKEVRIERAKELPRFTFIGSANIIYDDNVTLSPTEEVGALIPQTKDKEDWAGVVTLGADFKFLRIRSYYAGISYQFYQSLYFDLTDYDLTGHFPSIAAGIYKPPYFFEIKYLLSYYYLDWQDFERIHQGSAKLLYIWSNKTQTELTIAYEDKNFFQTEDKSASNPVISIYQYYTPLEKRLSLYLGYRFNTEDAESDIYDYTGHKIIAGGNLRLISQLYLGAEYSYYYKDYKEEDPVENETRTDARNGINASLSYRFTKNFRIKASYRGVINSSSVAIREYKRNIYSVGLDLSF